MKEDQHAPLHDQLRRLRMAEEYAQARKLIRIQPGFRDTPGLQKLLHEHEDFWWSPLTGRRVTLKRRCAADAQFVRACWADVDFMRKFNRFARALPQDDEQLRQLLTRERAGLPSEVKALHWTIHTASGPAGFISATEYSPAHRRCEFMIGMLRDLRSPAPIEATCLGIRFLRDRLQLERMTAYFYSDNKHAIRVAEKFGFRPEGVLKSYVRDSQGNRLDVTVSGLVLGSEIPFENRWKAR